MSILFCHPEKDDGSVVMSEERIGGQLTPERRYQHIGHFLEVDAPPNAREHDIEQLQQLGYRLATAEEQNKFTKQKKKSQTVDETLPPKSEETPQVGTGDQGEDIPPVVPPENESTNPTQQETPTVDSLPKDHKKK
jgi:hypothetical protein